MTRAQAATEINLTGSVRQEIGQILTRSPLRARAEGAEFDARVAASCLLAPEEGDAVLLALPSRGPAYVLAVLERRSEGPAHVRVEGADMHIEAPDGRLRLSSPQALDLVTAELRLVSKELDVVAGEGRLRVTHLLSETRTLLARGGVMDAAFQALETAAERATARFTRSYRFVEDTDVTRAGSIDARARESLLLRAKDALMSARRLVRLDGEQIHLG